MLIHSLGNTSIGMFHVAVVMVDSQYEEHGVGCIDHMWRPAVIDAVLPSESCAVPEIHPFDPLILLLLDY